MTFSLFQFATSKLVPNKAMVPACIMQLQKTQAKHQSRLVVRTYTISDIYERNSAEVASEVTSGIFPSAADPEIGQATGNAKKHRI